MPVVLPFLAAMLLPAPHRAQAAPAPRATLTIFAAASLTDAFDALAARMRARRPDLDVRMNYAGSQQLVAQLAQGAGADVLATADAHWMDEATAQGLLAGAPEGFAGNRLVVIVPRANPARIDRLQDLARPGIKLVLGAATVPVGRYAREVLRNLSRRPGFGAGFAPRALANLVSEEENVKAVVAKVQLGEADAGIVYRSDVGRPLARFVRVFELPAEANVLARYPIAVVRGSRHANAARAFVDLVRSAEGQALLCAHGFLPAPADTGAPAPARP